MFPLQRPSIARLAIATLAAGFALASVLGGDASASPKVRVAKVATAKRLTQGSRYVVHGRLRNRVDRKVRGRLRLALSPVRGRPGRLRVGGRRIRVRARRVSGYVAVARISRRIAPGPYFLVVCFRSRGRSCRSTRVRVLSQPSRPPQPEPTPARPPDPGPPYAAGARSAGDPLFPEIGNGGYDAIEYDIRLLYEPSSNRFEPGTHSTMTAKATDSLWEFSLDYEGPPVSRVEVNGENSWFRAAERKLIVAPPRPIEEGQDFTVDVSYSGYVNHIVDPDGSREGWVRACRTGLPGPGNPDCFGSFTVSEPIGAQSWFPSNNVPADKAAFETATTVPTRAGADQWTALGTGVFVSKVHGPRGTTWRWRESKPTSTYLTTGSVGRFVYGVDSAHEALSGREIPLYNAYDASATAGQATDLTTAMGRQAELINLFAPLFGPYPFDSAGVLAARTTGVGYALENQGKIHFPGLGIGMSTLAHEYVHQWFGDAVGPRDWSQIWFNEGWAQWGEWYFDSPSTPADQFAAEYAAGDDPERWAVPPATLNGDPALLFEEFTTYIRPAMMLEGYRQIVGEAKFSAFAKKLQAEHAYSTIGAAGFVAAAVEAAGFDPAREAALEDYFQQWLYLSGKPTMTPANFPPQA